MAVALGAFVFAAYLFVLAVWEEAVENKYGREMSLGLFIPNTNNRLMTAACEPSAKVSLLEHNIVGMTESILRI